ncbi:hypothetical protein [Baekduia sp.]|uniref:hypothetical protein n=1 Tax=Baekduia sp. TaxID=2600305 RepID=UPI002D1FB0E9|nr:hypothetical protein [Baekduia sp.]
MAALAAIALLTAGPPVASASSAFSPGACSTPVGTEAQGGTAGTANSVCMGGGQVDIGSSVGQIASVSGGSIADPAAIGNMVVSAGDVATGS